MVRFAKTAVIALIVPVISYIAASWGLSQIGAASGDGVGRALASCGAQYLADGYCGSVLRLGFMRGAALWTGVGSLALLASFFVLGRVAGTNRALNAAIFPTLMPLTTLLIAVVLIIQGASLILPALFDDLGSFLMVGLLGLLGVGALIGGGLMLQALRRMTKPQPQPVLAHQMKRREAAELWSFVEGVAKTIDAQPPDHIVVGLEPNFFATAAPVVTPDSEGVLKGETMYLSAPLMRLFTEAELKAVVAHELGHFTGDDTVYSLKFAPVYRRIAVVLQALEGEDGRADHVGSMPAAVILRYLMETFAINERAISREREHAADLVGAAAGGPEALATSLAKVAIYAPLWGKVREDNVDRLSAGKVSRNLSRVYADAARFDVSTAMIEKVVELVLQTEIAHPTDSHPSIAERYQGIGFDSAALNLETLARYGGASDGLFADRDRMERDLTLLEHQIVIASGLAQAPDKDTEAGTVIQAAYILAAAMVTADGETKNAEIDMAESIGQRLFENFDPVSFREIVADIDETPSFHELVGLLDEALSLKQKRLLHAYLGEIADSDAEVAEAENALLEHLVKAWGVKDPLWRRLAPFKPSGGGSKRKPVM